MTRKKIYSMLREEDSLKFIYLRQKANKQKTLAIDVTWE